MSIVLGTAGHIDHGKSTLVKALTGTDPDRLKEEKERGITIDLGFAHLDLPSGKRLGIVDVPGHERLIRNMLAGVGGIDVVMLVVAADEGIMPQTREHLAICDLLCIRRGLVAITKVDAVEPEWVDLVAEEVRDITAGTFLEGCPILPVSARTREGLEALVATLDTLAEQVEPRSNGGVLRLPLDRAFTLKGFGTVVTGTLVSGRIRQDEAVAVLPRGISGKVRGLQLHGRKAAEAMAGQRTAVNLQGVEKHRIRRGDVLAHPDTLIPTSLLEARLHLLKDIPQPFKTRTRVRLHVGTAEVMARVVLMGVGTLPPGGEAFVQIRLEEPVVASSGDRYVIRRYSPLETLGGGEVLDPSPRRHRPSDPFVRESLTILERGDLGAKLAAKLLTCDLAGMTGHDLEGWIQADVNKIRAALEDLRRGGKVHLLDRDRGHFIHTQPFMSLQERMVQILEAFHQENPLKPGLSKEELRGRLGRPVPSRLFNQAQAALQKAGAIAVDQDTVRVATFAPTVGAGQEDLRARILALYRDGEAMPPLVEDAIQAVGADRRVVTDLIRLLAREGLLARINDSLYFHQDAYAAITRAVRAFLSSHPDITVAQFRDLVKTTRKYAVPLAEHLDTTRITLRKGDKRVLHPGLAEA